MGWLLVRRVAIDVVAGRFSPAAADHERDRDRGCRGYGLDGHTFAGKLVAAGICPTDFGAAPEWLGAVNGNLNPNRYPTVFIAPMSVSTRLRPITSGGRKRGSRSRSGITP